MARTSKNDPFKGKTVFVTGGTGSFGNLLVRTLLNHHSPAKVVVFSRDELKQFEMQQSLQASRYPQLRFFLGDIRDKERLHRALAGVDIVVHAAALKQVPAAEYNPLEAIKTNVLGAANIIDASIDNGVKQVIALSTDKACNPVNLYGATKLCSDKLFIAGNNYSGKSGTRFSVVRYGNVVGSRGSVVPLFLSKRASGVIPITDPRMTRFWITLPQGVSFVLRSLARMEGGELFVPKIPSMKVTEIARAIAPGCRFEMIGIRPGEKLHETLVSTDDARHAVEYDDQFIVRPAFHEWTEATAASMDGGRPCESGFSYCSDSNTQWLSAEDIRDLAETFVHKA